MIIPVSFAQVNIRFGGSGMPRGAEVTFGVDNGTTVYDAPTIAGIIGGLWVDHIKAITNVNTTCDEVLVKLGPNSTGASAVLGIGEAGTVSSGAPQPAVALLVQKQTALGGRHGRGRMYWPILGSTWMETGSVLTTAHRSTLQTAMGGILSDLATALIPMVLLHGDLSVAPTEVIGLNVETQLATQRRRLRK